LLATEAAKALVGEMPSTEVLRAAAAIAAEREIDPSTDIHASSRYRRQLASVLTRRALERAFTRAEASQESRP
jgi:CO/xanthine dehydrogenase FAD-binding subunit